MPHEAQRPAEIERDLARERDQLAETLEDLRDRLSFEGAWKRAGRHLRENGSNYGQTFGNMVREKPLAIALTTIGLAWLIFGPATGTSAHRNPDRRRYSRSADVEHPDGGRAWRVSEEIRREATTGMPAGQGTERETATDAPAERGSEREAKTAASLGGGSDRDATSATRTGRGAVGGEAASAAPTGRVTEHKATMGVPAGRDAKRKATGDASPGTSAGASLPGSSGASRPGAPQSSTDQSSMTHNQAPATRRMGDVGGKPSRSPSGAVGKKPERQDKQDKQDKQDPLGAPAVHTPSASEREGSKRPQVGQQSKGRPESSDDDKSGRDKASS